jgi:hypothetical protein
MVFRVKRRMVSPKVLNADEFENTPNSAHQQD